MKLVRKDVFNLAMPIFTEQLFVISLGMINTMMAGHIGKEAVSAIGGMVIVAQFVGQVNIKKASYYETSALFWTYN
jgi:Na+-driven multidrug efflux pump